jgi:uncharacterized protein (TIGR02996 family)
VTQALFDAVCKSPYDDAPRLAYAAWLDARTPPDPKGEFIRLSIRAARESLRDKRDFARWMNLKQALERHAELLALHEYDWKRDVLAIAEECEFDRGLVASASLPADRFIARGADLFALAPIVHVELTDAAGVMQQLANCPLLEKVHALTLRWQQLTSADIAILASSPYMSNLWALDLIGNAIDIQGIETMALSPQMKRLRHTELQGNPGDVHERAGYEFTELVSLSFPPGGERLEARLGRIPWLHYSDPPVGMLGPPLP